MKRLFLITAIFAIAAFVVTSRASAEEVLFGFEEDTQGWEIPDWAYEQGDYVGEDLATNQEFATEGTSSLKLLVNFPGGKWSGAVTEVMEFFDWTPYSAILCDIALPEDAPVGLRAKIVLTVSEDWEWVEMSRSIRLKPGETVTIKANLKPGSEDWRRMKPTDEFRADVRKIAIRVESTKPAYEGPVYIDNIRLAE